MTTPETKTLTNEWCVGPHRAVRYCTGKAFGVPSA